MRTYLPRALATLLAIGLTACGRSEALETRTFDVRHLEPEIAYEIVQPYVFADRSQSPGAISLSREGRTLTIREQSDNLNRIERVLEERDHPVPSVTLHFQIIEAGSEETTLDPSIAEVEAAIREVFRFRGYRLLGETVVRASDRSEFSQLIASPAAHAVRGKVWAIQVRDDGELSARLSLNFWTDPKTMAFETTVNLVGGRTLVLGTAGGSGEDEVLILVVRPVFEK